jgi:hypothetical protein
MTPTPLSPGLRASIFVQRLLMLALAVMLFWGAVKLIGGTVATQDSHTPVSLSEALGGQSDPCPTLGAFNWRATGRAWRTDAEPAFQNFEVECAVPGGQPTDVEVSH